ncbi:MAG TPA: carboxylate--amine ligase [Deltaproteobacteria bacterium]|nr:carboxylate--amine ligase [Deltaproteobacteria bacterium]
MSGNAVVKIINSAMSEGRNCLSEYEAKQVLAFYGLPVTREVLINNVDEFKSAARQIGYPLAMKGCSSDVAHKTEKGLIHLGVNNEKEALAAFAEIKKKLGKKTGAVLVQEMVRGSRELVMGMTRDEQFGPCVMFGLGGIFTEILRDVSFRKSPLKESDAMEMMREIRGCKIIDAFRGMAAADQKMLASMLVALGRIGLDFERVREIDLNPVIISGPKPVVVDALIIIG